MKKYRWNQWRPIGRTGKGNPIESGRYEVQCGGRVGRWKEIVDFDPANEEFKETHGWRRKISKWRGKPLAFLSYDDAIKKMKFLARGKKEVSVFVDRGWGDSGQVATYEIIKDGNGQFPYALLTPEVFEQLLKKKILGGNNLITYKARRNHPFLNGKRDAVNNFGRTLFRDAAKSKAIL